MDSKALRGKSALVTGASQGIGLACARALAQDGAAVVIMGRDPKSLGKAQAELRAQFPDTKVEMFAGDAIREADTKAALSFTHGLANRLDIVVSTVGGPVFQPLLMRDVESVRQEMDRNFTTGFLITRHGVPLMKRDGAIVCISTAAVTQPTWGLSIYAAGKAALERFVRAAAYELAGAGIRINSVRPGATLSEERAALPEVGPMSKAYIAETPMGRLGHPDDIGRVVRFLAGPESGWVTGQTFSVDGGLDQRNGPDFMDAFFTKEVMDQIRAGKPVDHSP
jgi:NAD(P)-dependent dehydrogenase (short-subunit alcohol dehydrogenase family)